MKSSLLRVGIGALLLELLALPAVAATPVLAVDLTHRIGSWWVPATAYGLTMIAALGKSQK